MSTLKKPIVPVLELEQLSNSPSSALALQNRTPFSPTVLEANSFLTKSRVNPYLQQRWVEEGPKIRVSSGRLPRNFFGGSETPYAVQDLDALDFLTRTALIEDPIINVAVDEFTLGLKTDNLWDKITCLYPFVGGTSYRHSLDLKNRDEGFDSYQILWKTAGAEITHSELGSKGDLSSLAYGVIQKESDLPLMNSNNCCYAFYVEKTSATNGVIFGQVAGASSFNGSYSSFSAGVATSPRIKASASQTVNNTQSKGFLGATRASSSASILHPDGVVNATQTPVGNTGDPSPTDGDGYTEDYKVHIMRRRTGSSPSYSDDWIRFFMIGDQFSASDMTALRNRVTTLQTALGRA